MYLLIALSHPFLTRSHKQTKRNKQTHLIYLRSLGVHISFVRSIAMDSWTDPQLKLMKCGGNQKCADYLSAKGVASGTAIKPKYESDAAQLYKEVLQQAHHNEFGAPGDGEATAPYLLETSLLENTGAAADDTSDKPPYGEHGGWQQVKL